MSPATQASSQPATPAPLSLADLAKTVSTLPFTELAAFQEILLSHMIQKTPGVMGGAACVRKTRIAVWILVSLMQQGASSEELLLDYPGLTSLDLWATQVYYLRYPREIDDLIAAHDREGTSQARFMVREYWRSDCGSP
ncbi:DUF433 domain-containing protein [Prochlorothrix hollandica]|uniref:DUF433 domain-containing protein n=1 Tax=Prochlorothrix hollandica TaxID=1223 RepID=UPI00333EAD69